MIIGRTFHFDAAHYLPEYEGKCKNVHGHTWKVTIEVEGDIQDEGSHKGMVIDLSELKQGADLVLGIWDHNVLNKLTELTPTCENLALIIADRIQAYLSLNVKVKSVQVQEGEGGYARWER